MKTQSAVNTKLSRRLHAKAQPAVCQIAGFGAALPEMEVSNHQFEAILDTSDEWITQRTGISNRRFCGPQESSATLAIEASKKAISMARIPTDRIDLIICATVSPQSVTPPNATRIQAALSCPPIPAFDISAACSGFLFALSTAETFLNSGRCKTALVVGAEALSRRMNFADRNSCILFGDAAGAVILNAPSEFDSTSTDTLDAIGVSAPTGPRMLSCDVQSMPDLDELIRVPSNTVDSENSLASDPEFLETGKFDHLGIDGREVFRFAIETMCQCIRDTATKNKIAVSEIDLIVPHQVNTRVFDAVAERLKIDRDKIFSNLANYGNTSAASVPVALEEVARTGAAKPGDLVCVVAFGGGLSCGSAMLHW